MGGDATAAGAITIAATATTISTSLTTNRATTRPVTPTGDQVGTETMEGAPEGEQGRARAGIRRRHHRDFRQRVWFSARSEAQFRPDAAGYFRHARNRTAFCLARRHVDLRRNASRQSRSAIDQAAHDQWRGADEISGPAPIRRADHDQSEQADQTRDRSGSLHDARSWI